MGSIVAIGGVWVCLVGCGGSTASTSPSTTSSTRPAATSPQPPPTLADRAERALQRVHYTHRYAIAGVKDAGIDGLSVITDLADTDGSAASDICTILTASFKSLALIRVYGEGGREIESDDCGPVSPK